MRRRVRTELPPPQIVAVSVSDFVRSSLHYAFIQTGWLLITSFLLLLLCFNVRLTGNSTAATMAVLLTLLCGGVGGFVWLFTDFTWDGFFQ